MSCPNTGPGDPCVGYCHLGVAATILTCSANSFPEDWNYVIMMPITRDQHIVVPLDPADGWWSSGWLTYCSRFLLVKRYHWGLKSLPKLISSGNYLLQIQPQCWTTLYPGYMWELAQLQSHKLVILSSLPDEVDATFADHIAGHKWYLFC